MRQVRHLHSVSELIRMHYTHYVLSDELWANIYHMEQQNILS